MVSSREIFTEKWNILVHIYHPALRKTIETNCYDFTVFASFHGANIPTMLSHTTRVMSLNRLGRTYKFTWASSSTFLGDGMEKKSGVLEMFCI